MPNSQAPANGSAPSRRMFLSGAVAVAATAAGGSLLSACSTPNNASGNGGVAAGSSLKKLLPAYVASNAVQPDIAGVNGSTPGFLKYPANLVTSVSGTPGKGGSYKAMTPAWWSIPSSDNAYFKAVNKALGTNIKIQESDGNTYQDKIGAILASSDIPDWMNLPTWNLTGQIPNAVGSKFADLGPYLSGDEIKKYPNLAAIPTAAWQYATFGGKLKGIPLSSELKTGNPVYYRKDIFDTLGVQPPKSAAEFLSLAKQITDAKNNRWACDDMWVSAQAFFGCVPDRPSYWKLDNGKLVNKVETEEYLAALDWTRKLFKAGVVHPDAVALKTADAKTRFESGKTLIYSDGNGAWHEAVARQAAINPKFNMQAMDFFAADGGDPTLWYAAPAYMFSFLNKKLSKAQIEELLAVANYLAAPFGTKEYELVTYGAEGVHFKKDKNGIPQTTDQGKKDVTSSYGFLSTPPPAYAYVAYPQNVKDYCAWDARMAPFFKKPLFYGMQIQEPTRFATLGASFIDLQNDYTRGRKSLSDVKSAISSWRSTGGEELRTFYKKILDANGGAS